MFVVLSDNAQRKPSRRRRNRFIFPSWNNATPKIALFDKCFSKMSFVLLYAKSPAKAAGLFCVSRRQKFLRRQNGGKCLLELPRIFNSQGVDAIRELFYRKFRLLHSTSFDDAIQILAERFTNLLAYCRNIHSYHLLPIFYFHRMLLAILKI